MITFVSVNIDCLEPGNVPEFKFNTLPEALAFMEICFKNGFSITAYQAE